MKYVSLPFVNGKSRPLVSYYGSLQQNAIAKKLASKVSQGKISKNFMDLAEDNKFYGRVNHRGFPVIPLEEGIFENLPSKDRPLVCIDFVASNFQGGKRTFDDVMALDGAVDGVCSARDFNSAVGYIEGLSETKLQAYRGWDNPHRLHRQHVSQEIMPIFLQNYIFPFQGQIKSINDVIALLQEFCKEFSRDCLLTFTSFVLSPKMPIHSTGLAVDIMQADSNDMEKKLQMMNSTGYKSLVETMRKNGFKSNINTPWTMVADIKTKAMSSKMKEYGVESMQNMFDEYYIETYMLDHEKLVDFVIDAYYTLLNRFESIVMPKYCADGSFDRVITKPRRDSGKTGKELKQEIDERLLMRTFLEARSKESPREIRPEFLDRILSISAGKIKKKGIIEAYKVANREILNLDDRFLATKNASIPKYLTPAANSVNINQML